MNHDDIYQHTKLQMQAAFNDAAAHTKVFTTDTAGLWPTFIESLPIKYRAHYNCRTCKKFVEDYGGLVTINTQGQVEPLFWGWSSEWQFAMSRMYDRVSKSRVTGVFFHDNTPLGTRANTDKWGVCWTHMSCEGTTAFMPKRPSTPSQAAANSLEEYKMLRRVLRRYTLATADIAVMMLESGDLYRSEASIKTAKAFAELKALTCDKAGDTFNNLVWTGVAFAPPGFAHVRTGMVGTLLEDIQQGLSFDAIKRKFDAKMAPTKYQRPKAAPRAGNIAAAEKLVKELGLEASLSRRYAQRHECELDWYGPNRIFEDKTGVFSHLKARAQTPISVRSKRTMTWSKFEKEVLHKATRIRAVIPNQRHSFSALVTAANTDAPNIIQWGHPVTWYTCTNGSLPREWNLAPSRVEVTGICKMPVNWYDNPSTHHGDGRFILLEGCKHIANRRGNGGGLFPSHVKSELHGIRSVIEAHSNSSIISGVQEATASGIMIREKVVHPVTLVVTTALGDQEITIDRWD